MKNRYFIFLIFSISFLVSCQDDDGVEDNMQEINNDEILTGEEFEEDVECPQPVVENFSFKIFDSNNIDLIESGKYNLNDISLLSLGRPVGLNLTNENESTLEAFFFRRTNSYTLKINEKLYELTFEFIFKDTSENSCSTSLVETVIFENTMICEACNQMDYVKFIVNE